MPKDAMLSHEEVYCSVVVVHLPFYLDFSFRKCLDFVYNEDNEDSSWINVVSFLLNGFKNYRLILSDVSNWDARNMLL